MADPVFFDRVSRRDDTHSQFEITRLPAPDSWSRVESDEWIHLFPHETTLPDQGWKVHVGATMENAERVGRTTWTYCVENSLSFKFLRSRDVLLTYNTKYAPRTASGKFITIYPIDESALHRLLVELDEELSGEPAPYILSDLRWRAGPLFTRYGGFRSKFLVDDDGEVDYAITDPEGVLHPDRRRPVFELPPWVALPEFLVPHHAARHAPSGSDLPYTVVEALHFSNGGGVYLADRRTDGARVVLKEARPLAGLDGAGQDAVARLRRERWALERLAGVPGVPAYHGYFTLGEHEFLVEEYVEGERLAPWAAHESPLANEVHPTAHQLAEYAASVLSLLQDLKEVVARLHERGVVFGDLHPGNVIRRPDGSVALVDFELAHAVDGGVPFGLGTHGFLGRARNGVARDRYALAALGLWFFLPLTRMFSLAPERRDDYLGYVAEHFPVPPGFLAELRNELCIDEATGLAAGGAKLVALPSDGGAAERSMAAAVLLSATADREDRLFPGDIAQLSFDEGGIGFAHGAAGVLWALSITGHGRRAAHEEWLLNAMAKAALPRPGFYDGAHGLAYVAGHFGYTDEANALVERTLPMIAGIRSVDLYGGLAGVGLNLLHFASENDDARLLEEAAGIAKRLTAAPELGGGEGDSLAPAGAAGLLRGWSGPALFLIRLAAQTDDPAYLDFAVRALHRDLDWCVSTRNGSLQVNDVGLRGMPYLEVGSAGIALVADELLSQRSDDRLEEAVPLLVRACSTESVVEPGLFVGRAGLLATVSRLGSRLADQDLRPVLARHVDRLKWHAVSYRGHLAFPGTGLMRLSMDLATGTAGVLLGLHIATAERAGFLPFFDARPGWCGKSQAGRPPAVAITT